MRSFREAEKVETEVVGVGSEGKGATAAKTEEIIDSAKEAYISIAVRDRQSPHPELDPEPRPSRGSASSRAASSACIPPCGGRPRRKKGRKI